VRAEYAAVRAFAGFCEVLPERLAILVGRLIGAMAWAVKAKARRLARENIEKAMPGEMTSEEVARLVRRVFIHMATTVVETFWLSKRMTKETVEERFTVEGEESARAALAGGGSVLVFTSHLGNWEIAGGCIAIRFGGLNALARPAANPLIEAYLAKFRERMHSSVLSTEDGLRPLVAALRKGGLLAVLIDQHVRTAYVPATFFGRRAATTSIVAALALKMDLPVFAAYSFRDGHSFRHHVRVEGPLPLVRTGDYDADVAANTQAFNDYLEPVVRRHPEQWLWAYRRWRLADKLDEERQEEHVEG
jgi:KDO2-lipid IV(A) lauroyltransferase